MRRFCMSRLFTPLFVRLFFRPILGVERNVVLMVVGVMLGVFVAAASAAQAQTLTSSGRNSGKEPIQISADSLEVLQQEQKAIFKGNVIAKQGDVTLKSDVMNVFYRNNKGDDAATKPASTEASSSSSSPSSNSVGGSNGVSKIVVEGNVTLATDSETAQGQKGIYDVDKKMIFLNGNITLTREKNVLKGDRLEYNLATGRSLVSSGGSAVPGQNPGRVRGLFVPQNDKKP